MQLTLVVLGSITVKIDATDEKDAIKQASFWQSLPDVCPECRSELTLHFKSPKNYKYYLLRCIGKPAHESNFGVKMDDESLYYKADWQKAFGNGQHGEEAETYAADAEPKAEHGRLDGLIRQEWTKETRSISFAESVEKRFGVTPDKLKIEQKRQILTSLQNKTAPAPA